MEACIFILDQIDGLLPGRYFVLVFDFFSKTGIINSLLNFRGDTTVILGSYLGTQLGNWCNFQLGILKGPPLQPPYPILWPTYETYVVTILRMAIGGVVIIATRAIAKPLVFYTSAYIVNGNPAELKLQKPTVENKKKLITELRTKFFSYLAVGFSCTFIVPIVFRVISCERATFHTEV